MKHPTLTESERLRLIQDIYEFVFRNVESFEEQRIGEDLAYLLGAIAKNGWCSWPASRALIKLFRRHLAEDHLVWQYIEVKKA